MTKLTKAKTSTVRETGVFERSSALIVALYPTYLTVRLKGSGEALAVGYGDILALGRRMARKKAS